MCKLIMMDRSSLIYWWTCNYRWNQNPSHDHIYWDSSTIFTEKDYGQFAGFDFVREYATASYKGAFYMITDEHGVTKIYGNNEGQGGAIDMGPGSLNHIRSAPGGVYERHGVEVKEGHNYAIYDSNDNIYGVIHIDRVRISR